VVLGLCVGHDSLFSTTPRDQLRYWCPKTECWHTTRSGLSTWPIPITVSCGDLTGRRSRRRFLSRAAAA
jgi:hypothetical protein